MILNHKNYSQKVASIILLSLELLLFNSNRLSVAQVTADETLGFEKSVVTPSIIINDLPSNQIKGGAIRGINLFHSFREFNVREGEGIYFSNPIGIENIISRVTGRTESQVMGTLGVQGKANLFIINPNGVIFGSNSSLDLNGSFVASTANALQFGEQEFFEISIPNAPSLLTVNPSAFLFRQINASPIVSQSIKSVETRRSLDPSLSSTEQVVKLSGLRVADGRSLVLLGGDITINGGRVPEEGGGGGLTALGGRVILGSILDIGKIDLKVNGNNLNLSFPENMNFGNVSLLNGARLDASGQVDNSGIGNAGGSIQLTAKNIQIKDESQIVTETTGLEDGGSLSINATGSFDLRSAAKGGTISTFTTGVGSAGDINIKAGNILVTDGGSIVSSSLVFGSSGKINVTSSGLIELTGTDSFGRPSLIFSSTFSQGAGGDILIVTPDTLIVSDGAGILSGPGQITLSDKTTKQIATGKGGNIDIRAIKQILISDGVLLADSIISTSGNINIETKKIDIKNGAIFVSSSQGLAGTLNIVANSFILDSSTISAETSLSGANIFLDIIDTLILKNESKITAAASNNADGGNIKINTSILLVLPPVDFNGSDIVAQADKGRGGNIVINSKGVFGIAQGKAIDGNQTNDIDASSQFGQSGQVQINTTTDPNQGLVELPATVIDPSTLVAQNPCKRASSSEFTRSGRGGLPPNLSQDLNGESTQVGLVEPVNLSAEKPEPKSNSKPASSVAKSSSQIAPAQGWVYNNKGEVVLVAYNSAITGSQRIQPAPAGCPVF